MRLTRPDGSTVHVAYCTNVHPATRLEGDDGILAQLEEHAAAVRDALGLTAAGEPLGVGLWLPADVADSLAADADAGGPAGGPLRTLRETLDRLGLEVVTLNAFPYGDFHGQRDKRAVYHPDWTAPERLAHTLTCARVLTALLPDDVATGTVSTLPLAWREPWDDDRRAAAGAHLAALDTGLRRLAEATGRRVRVGFEPEPGCVWEVLDDALHPTRGLGALLAEHGVAPAADGALGVCLDTCHSAVGFDDLTDAAARLARADVGVVKLQASAAVHVERPADPAGRAAVAAFDEARFLHQVRELAADGTMDAVDDVPDALRCLPGEGLWRCHVHAPLHARWDGPARPLTGPLETALDTLVVGSAPPVRVDVVEVETYTWSVLPAEHRVAAGGTRLADGVAAELAWVRDRLTCPTATEVA
ncbi:metabolite traffic protein EboE [Aquipuribacter nitratireducens]|uniref:Metabolite traffic protein EboE n=1 Tax=Aquipuribacter nitratireducens TaxID=650104 RepID=A0ABW0GJ42_9MICO